jgi:hypothetical protein
MALPGDVKHVNRYLNNLIARQLDRESPVQPRLPSLFESPAHASAFTHERSDAGEPLAVETVEAETGVDVRPEIRHSIETTSALPSSRFNSSSIETASTVWRGRQKIAPGSWPSAELAPDKTGEAATQIQTAMSPPEGVHPAAANITPPASAAPSQNVHKPSPQHGAASELQDKANEQTGSPRLKQSTVDSAPVDSKKNSIVVEPRVVLLVENRREANDFALRNQPPAPEPPPEINVTIGRVEVRAAAPYTTPRSQPSAKPSMSLDEYLRRRTKGGGGV